jgi:Aromatic-ring-opening dioxygenase LigAB, LigA subunit
MSLYAVNKVSHLLQVDPAFRDLMATDPVTALGMLPLSEEERNAILRADVAALYEMGAHTFLLSRIPRFLPDLVSRDQYIERMRSVLTPDERAELEAESRAR